MAIIIRNGNQNSNKSFQYVLAVLTREIAIQEKCCRCVPQTAMTKTVFEQNQKYEIHEEYKNNDS